MRALIILLFLFIISSSFSQTLIAKTEDGRRVILKDNNTWEFIDKTTKSTEAQTASPTCDLPANYQEPEGNKKIQGLLRKVDATAEDLKNHVAVDLNCSPKEVKIISISEQKGNGNYVLCVKGKEVRYRRIGSAFLKSDENPFPNKN